MSSPDIRHQARRVALGALFSWAFLSRNAEGLADNIVDLMKIKEYEKSLATSIIKGVIDNLSLIDKIIQNAAPQWPLDQVAKVDLTVLRMAVFELFFAHPRVPQKVAINEAVELAKEFGGENSGRFVNGVLGTVVRTLS